jgi:UPF0271 protein
VAAIDLNADLGEGVTDDAGLLAVVSSANVACGYHAGDGATMRRVCEQAVARGVVIGAQVSYDDRANFGRVARDVPPDLLAEQVAHQVGMLAEAAVAAGGRVAYLKPHGALYNRVVHDEEQAEAVLAGAGPLPVLGLPGGALLRLAAARGRVVHREGFPDRGYTPHGTLVPRGEPGALIEDPAVIAARAVELVRGGRLSSVCVHGDSPRAVQTATRVRAALRAAGFSVQAFVEDSR